MASKHDFGFVLDNGTRIVHGEGSIVKQAFPPETKLPGTMQVFTQGNKVIRHVQHSAAPVDCFNSIHPAECHDMCTL